MEDLTEKHSEGNYFRILVPQFPSVECSSPEHSATYAPKSSQTNALEPSTNHRDAQACAKLRHGDSAQLHAQHPMPLTPEKPSGAEGRGKPRAYYNEWNKHAAQWLRNLIADGQITPGDVDERSIEDVQASDLRGYTRVHFFAGIAGWERALRLAGWPAEQSVWTGSCPCNPYSVGGKMRGDSDPRNLWPQMFRLIRDCRPSTIFGEQVASHAGYKWLDGVRVDLDDCGYAVGAADLCAAGVKAPHVRQRLWWFAHAASDGCQGIQRCSAAQVPQDWAPETLDAWHGSGNPFEQWEKLLAEPDVRRVDDGVSSTVDIRPRLHAYGNAIVPQVGAVFVRACADCVDLHPTQPKLRFEAREGSANA